MKRTRALGVAVVTALIVGFSAAAAAAAGPLVRLRIENNDRIQEVFDYTIKHSLSFQDLVTTLELGDHAVYITEGRCPRVDNHACLQLTPGQPKATLIVRIDPRQPIMSVAALLAHELYHAAEILREPDVDDAASLHQLYERIGYRTCAGQSDDCWETRAAKAFQELVWRQLSSQARDYPSTADLPGPRR